MRIDPINGGAHSAADRRARGSSHRFIHMGPHDSNNRPSLHSQRHVPVPFHFSRISPLPTTLKTQIEFRRSP